ncbi:uncharacterized protein LOC107035929 [Diachasma alloeum]|uniref:uncharacterized protein LOC107035929 n=1 Tax=Diachasma alloeum TaxID=454923 RepID=UPI00073848C6|nr:uncharacterized protein LOC107035929 [Diachasma alloeum]XP_015109066.1 uncharacterized protein LOC107035929 [Diachasma alloeum]XP_015109067.1 uncharacterized protein LOC107035929 [Diachasma alloeum]
MATLEAKVISDFYKYRTDYDGYTVYFENTKHYTKKEVRRIFTKYGAVRKVAQSEVYLCSHCFVAFVYEEDARKCIEAMNNTGDIQLLTITRGRIRPPHLLDKHRGRPANNPNAIPVGMKIVKKDGDNCRGKRRPINGQSDPKVNPKVGKNADKTSDETSTGHIRPLETITREDIRLEGNLDCNANIMDKFVQVSSEFSDLRQELRKEVIIFLKQLLGDLPQVIQKVTTANSPGQLGKSFYVPLKSRIPWRMIRSVRVEEVQAFPVVIANIHEICNVEFIMELLGMYEPMFGSKMKTIPGTLLRYCWVYFKSTKTAEAVERGFDNGKICGNCLVVRRVWVLGED